MRTLRIRPISDSDPQDTLRALRHFHVTRLEWAYITDAAFIRKVREMGVLFGGAAAAPSFAPAQADASWQDVCIHDAAGNTIIAPWKRAWRPTLWGCMNNPQLVRGYQRYLEKCVDAGAQVIQRDEPGGNALATRWGGCFCKWCMKGFRDDLARRLKPAELRELGIGDVNSFDYRQYVLAHHLPVGDAYGPWPGDRLKELFVDFQRRSTIEFHRRARRELDTYAGRHVPMSCNNGGRRWTEIEKLFDWGFGELSIRDATPASLHDIMQTARAHGRQQVVTMPKTSSRDDLDGWARLTRQTIATAYAFGGHCMVPWDVYMPGDAPRYFGTPEQYADMYAFIRGAARWLDGYEEVCAAGPGIAPPQSAEGPPVRVVGGGQVCVAARTKPGEANAPVVVHLIDWSAAPTSHQLNLYPERCFGDRPWRITLLTPAPYDAAAHARAQERGDFTSLLQRRVLAVGRVAAVEIPPLRPWGLLILGPFSATAAPMWSPTVELEPPGLYAPELRISLRAPFSSGAIHYALGGEAVTEQSPPLISPVRLTDTTELRARVFSAQGKSAETRVRFTRLDIAPRPLAPDAPGLRPALRLWLDADSLVRRDNDGTPVLTWPAIVGDDARSDPVKLVDGRLSTPPMLVHDALAGHAVVRFERATDSMAVPGFANRCLAGGAFTIIALLRSKDRQFGLCGNGLNGAGGVPRLYLTCSDFRYNVLDRPVRLPPARTRAIIAIFMHDGRETISAAANDAPVARLAGIAAVDSFGGGNLAMPFWGGNQPHLGEVGEIIAYDRQLSAAQRRELTAYLANKYGLPLWPQWRID